MCLASGTARITLPYEFRIPDDLSPGTES